MAKGDCSTNECQMGIRLITYTGEISEMFDRGEFSF